MTRRDISLDIIRILACFMVVLMHSPIPSINAIGPFLTSLSYFTAPSIGLFFMVSGALLLPIKTDYFTFIKKRFGKIVIPTVVWSLIYIALRLYNSDSEINVLQSVVSLPFSPQGSGVLWFMYTLAGLYLLAPILSAWLENASRKELELVLLIWSITLCYPLLDFYVITNTSNSGILYYFTGYAGYFLLGYYMKRYPERLSSVLLWGISLAGVVLILLLKLYNITFDFYTLFWYNSIFIVALAAAIWKAISHMKFAAPHTRLIALSNMSFGIYLMHILIMRRWLWLLDWIINISNYVVQTLVVALLTFVLSTICCLLLSYIPGAQWLTTYRALQKPTN